MKSVSASKPGAFEVIRRNDFDIAGAVKEAFDKQGSFPADMVMAVVEDGWITLSGLVDWPHQREAAYAAVRRLRGVRSVVNRILVSAHSASSEEVRDGIRVALKRSKCKDITGIVIEAEEGKVRLRGKVRTVEERDDAGIAVWFAPGVSTVINELIVNA